MAIDSHTRVVPLHILPTYILLYYNKWDIAVHNIYSFPEGYKGIYIYIYIYTCTRSERVKRAHSFIPVCMCGRRPLPTYLCTCADSKLAHVYILPNHVTFVNHLAKEFVTCLVASLARGPKRRRLE